MNKNGLIELRTRLLAEITPLVVENAGDGADRFSLLMRVIQSGQATSEIYDRAYESAHSIEQSPERLEALLALLDEVEVDLSRSEETKPDAESEPEQPRYDEEQQHDHESHDQESHF